ncbi:ABC transporter permease [Streptomyces sp. NPDC057909]|uniref:ABC transporter permease n=1 Tax=Streptomyces sp. NPDC057909 TaxID=3346277 RepID=UPI0036E73585
MAQPSPGPVTGPCDGSRAVSEGAVDRGEDLRCSSPRAWFLIGRLVRLAVSLLVVVTASFLIVHLVPGDPVRSALGMTADPAVVAARRAELGLDEPLLTQYLHYLGGVLTGDLGTSIISGDPVSSVIATRLPATVELAGLAVLLTALTAVPVGMWMAVATHGGRRRGADLAFTGVTGVFTTVPDFLIGVGLVFVFAVALPWLPPAGADASASYLLPVLALALGPSCQLARIIRAETTRVLGQDHLRVARSKRLPARLLYLRHALPNVLTAGLTVGGLLFAALVGGSVLVENVFAWPGLGSSVVGAIVAQDYPLVQAIVLLLGAVVLVVNLVVDLALGLLDPRSTLTRS